MIFSPKRNPKTKWESSSANRPRDGLMIPILSSGFASARKSRSEEHTSELQSHLNLVCRLLLEKKKNKRERRSFLTSSCAVRDRRSRSDASRALSFRRRHPQVLASKARCRSAYTTQMAGLLIQPVKLM